MRGVVGVAYRELLGLKMRWWVLPVREVVQVAGVLRRVVELHGLRRSLAAGSWPGLRSRR